jgi:hypothetical protein
MASAQEMRAEIESGYGSLKEAIEGVGGNWPAARPAAESVLRNELELAVTIAETMEALRLPERKQFTLESQAEALSALSEVAETCSKVFGYVEDRDLVKSTPFMDTIGGVLQAAAEQASGSAQTIKAAS